MDYVLVGVICFLGGGIVGNLLAPGIKDVEQSIKDHVTAEVSKLKAAETKVVSKVTDKAKQVKSVF